MSLVAYGESSSDDDDDSLQTRNQITASKPGSKDDLGYNGVQTAVHMHGDYPHKASVAGQLQTLENEVQNHPALGKRQSGWEDKSRSDVVRVRLADEQDVSAPHDLNQRLGNEMGYITPSAEAERSLKGSISNRTQYDRLLLPIPIFGSQQKKDDKMASSDDNNVPKAQSAATLQKEDPLFRDDRHELWRQRVSKALSFTIHRQQRQGQSLADEIMMRPDTIDPGNIDKLCERLGILPTLSSLGVNNPLRKFNASDYSDAFNLMMQKRDAERLRTGIMEYSAALAPANTTVGSSSNSMAKESQTSQQSLAPTAIMSSGVRSEIDATSIPVVVSSISQPIATAPTGTTSKVRQSRWQPR